MLDHLLIGAACLCEAAAAINWPKPSVNLMAAGLALYFLSLLV